MIFTEKVSEGAMSVSEIDTHHHTVNQSKASKLIPTEADYTNAI